MASGIYIIQNTLNKKCYVGSAVNLCLRGRDHFTALKRNRKRAI